MAADDEWPVGWLVADGKMSASSSRPVVRLGPESRLLRVSGQ